MLYVRLPTTRRAALEEHCSRLISVEQLAKWWPGLSPSNQALVDHRSGGSTWADASNFCETLAEISERFGHQVVIDTLAPLAIPVISSWEEVGKIANVDDTNVATQIASKGKKAGNALGEAHSRCYREYERRKAHYESYEDPDLQRWRRASRFAHSCPPTGSDLQLFTFYFQLGEAEQVVLGAGVARSLSVARELAAEEALTKWDIVEGTLEGRAKLIISDPKPRRARERRRPGRRRAESG